MGDDNEEYNQEQLRLMSAKNAQKKIELDARALANRINLLENEEKKGVAEDRRNQKKGS